MVFATFWVWWQGRAWPSASDRGAESSASNSSSVNMRLGRGPGLFR